MENVQVVDVPAAVAAPVVVEVPVTVAAPVVDVVPGADVEITPGAGIAEEAQAENDSDTEDVAAPADGRLSLEAAEAEAYPTPAWSCVVPLKSLQQALKHVTGALDKRSLKPILRDVLLTADARGVSLYGTDLEVGVLAFASSTPVAAGGSIVVPAHSLLSACTGRRAARDAQAEIRVAAGELAISVTIGTMTAKLLGADPAEFPMLPEVTNVPPSISVAGDVMIVALKRTVIAVSTEKQRYALNGLLFTLRENTLEVVGTDGHRLAVAHVPAFCDGVPELNAIVPIKAALLLLKMITKGEAVRIRTSATATDGRKQFCFVTEAGLVFGLTVDGRFPQYREVIPTPDVRKGSWTGNPHALADAVNDCFVSSRVPAVTLRSSATGLDVTGKSDDEERSSQAAGEYTGEPMTAQFNPSFLWDALGAFNGKGQQADAVEW